MLQRGLADAAEIARLGWDQPGVAHDRFHQHGGHLAAMALQAFLQSVEIVPRQQQNVVWRAVHAPRARQHGTVAIAVLREVFQRRVVAMEDRIAPAVVMSLEEDDAFAARKCPRQADRRRDGLGAGVGKPHKLHRGV